MASEAYGSLHFSFGFSCDFLDEPLMRSWSSFGQPAAPGKNHQCSKFSLLGDNSTYCGLLESQSLGNEFITVRKGGVAFFGTVCTI